VAARCERHPRGKKPAVIVCVCHFVREADIQRAYYQGAWTPEAVIMATGACSTCGCCRQMLEEVVATLDEAAAAEEREAPAVGAWQAGE
jgi:bacterioferritin-associated ferredoxin